MLLRFLISICLLQSVHSIYCDFENATQCLDSHECRADPVQELCYFKDWVDEMHGYCCSDMKCNTTGLVTGHVTDESELNVLFFLSALVAPSGFYFYPGTKLTCPIPYSFDILPVKQYPVDFTETGINTIIQCQINEDCGEGRYCGPSTNPAFDTISDIRPAKDKSGKNNTAIHFCYEDPINDSLIKMEIVQGDSSLHICEFHSDCNPPFYCHKISSDNEEIGICAIANICHGSIAGSLSSKTHRFCNNNSDCEKEGHWGECVNAPKQTYNLCCFKEKRCEYGIRKLPEIGCKKTAHCNVGKLVKNWNSWCDDAGYCCHDPETPNFGICPDNFTFALNENKCKSHIRGKKTSGVCPNNPDARCLYGHCCPGLQMNNGKPNFTQNSYVTNIKCDPNWEVPEHFRFAFCNGKNIVVIGIHHTNGMKLSRNHLKIQCNFNSDCEYIGYKYCVRETTIYLFCYEETPVSEKNLPDESDEKEPEEEEEMRKNISKKSDEKVPEEEEEMRRNVSKESSNEYSQGFARGAVNTNLYHVLTFVLMAVQVVLIIIIYIIGRRKGVKKSPKQKTPEKKNPKKKTPEKKNPKKKTPENKNPKKKTPEKKTPEKKNPKKKTPEKKNPKKKTPEKKNPKKNTSRN